MAGYDHQLGYKNTKVHSCADGFSRLPLKTKERAENVVHAANVFNMKQLEPLPDRLKTIHSLSLKNVRVDSVGYNYIQNVSFI